MFHFLIVQGKGKFFNYDGIIFEGEYLNGKREGKIEKKCSTWEGKGKLKYPDGSINEGEYLKGEKHGKVV